VSQDFAESLPTKSFAVFHLSNACYMFCPPYPSSVNHNNNIGRAVIP